MNLESYSEVAGPDVVKQLRLLAGPLRGLRVVHVNSTRQGGGVAEILDALVPLMRDVGLDVAWEVIEGGGEFYRCTKHFHNALQGRAVPVPQALFTAYEAANAATAARLGSILADADIVFIHDPQPAALLGHVPKRNGKWIWRCHIDLSRPYRPVWKYLRSLVAGYDASIFSLADFAPPLPHPLYLIPPSIDPLSEKNVELPAGEIQSLLERYDLDRGRPLIVQISRFDHFKDPVGVITAYRLAKAFVPGLQLVLAGGGAVDDPEGGTVLQEVQLAAASDPDIRVLLLPPDAHRTVNALQRGADVIIQKSLREGFGLTVTEALWKSRAVVGGDTGGIRLQVINHHTGFLVNSAEGAALRIRSLLSDRDRLERMGRAGREHVRQNFLITRQMREYLTVMLALRSGAGERVEIDEQA